jgi:hypothetical protein
LADNEIPNLAEIERIKAVADPVLRNLQITLCYHELAHVLAERTGRSANWCTFATWASKQAGQTIRKEDLGRTLQLMLGSEAAAQQAIQELLDAAHRLGVRLKVEDLMEVLWEAYDPEAAFERASEAVARGNLKVFAEIGREFARFNAAFLDDPAYDAEKITRFCEELIPGEPPDGQRYLRQAFTRYHRARVEADPLTRAQLILLANLEIGFHEQTRLQPEIVEALDAGVVDPRDVRDAVIADLFPQAAWLVRLRLWVARLLGRRSLLDIAVDALVAEEQRLVRRVLTGNLMSIDLGSAVRLRLGQDLGAGYPPSLRRIVLPELGELLDRIDPTPDSEQGSGAADWADLPDRIHFIADMFRCFGESPFLFDPPFTPAQLERIDAGERPADPL